MVLKENVAIAIHISKMAKVLNVIHNNTVLPNIMFVGGRPGDTADSDFVW